MGWILVDDKDNYRSNNRGQMREKLRQKMMENMRMSGFRFNENGSRENYHEGKATDDYCEGYEQGFEDAKQLLMGFSMK